MEIEKAIEILCTIHDDLGAIELGIEALKRVQQTRDTGLSFQLDPLPGETEPKPSE